MILIKNSATGLPASPVQKRCSRSASALLVIVLVCSAIGAFWLWRSAQAAPLGTPPLAPFLFFGVAVAALALGLRRRKVCATAEGDEKKKDLSAPLSLPSEEGDWRAGIGLAARDRIRPAAIACLLFILGLGAFLRLWGLDWDQGQHLHPDERFLTMVETSLQWPKSFSDYLDEAKSTLNPRNTGYGFFVYGTFPITIVKGLSLALNQSGYEQVHLVGRATSALLDLGSLLFLYGMARILYRRRSIALLAAFLYAVCVLPIQQSHFFTTDTFAVFFLMGALYFLALAQRIGRTRDFALSGIFFGLAMASKVSIFTFALLAPVVACHRLHRVWRLADLRRKKTIAACPEGPTVATEEDSAPSSTVHSKGMTSVPATAAKLAAQLALMGALSFLVFRVAQPDAFKGPGIFNIRLSERWLENAKEIKRTMSGDADMPPGHQWANRPPLWFPWKNSVLWGMGLPLGIAAWTGWAFAAWRLFRRRDGKHLLPVLWVGILFLHQGAQWVKSMRYLYPIYPMLALLAAWGLIHMLHSLRLRRKRMLEEAQQPEICAPRVPRRPKLQIGEGALLAKAALAIVVLGSLAWALAFTSIYRSPHSRVVASRWIYSHIPQNSSIGNEHWDDPLPLRIDGKDPYGGLYQGVEMQWYGEDTPEKLEMALGWLERSDYIVLSSNRLYDSIPRLPMRYPMTVRYYRALFDGTLGFEKIADITSYPRLFRVEFPDQGAEEAFSVYDHPRVQIFRKTENYSMDKARDILGSGIDWDSILRLWPKHLAQAPNALLIPEPLRPVYQQSGTWSEIIRRGNPANRHPIWAWAILIELLGLIAAPVMAIAMKRLPDRGYAFSKTAGLLMVGWLVWMLASLRVFTFSSITIWATLLALAATALIAAAARWRDAWRYIRNNWRLLFIVEAVFWFFFIGFVLIRWTNPDLWHPGMGGEKPMDFAYLNAVIRSIYFPPYDPWFAGGYLNYYYFGYVLVAMLVKVTGILPQVAYNLAIPMFFALLASGAFGVGIALNHRSRGSIRRMAAIGFVSAIFVAVIGNLGEAKLFLDGFAHLSQKDMGDRAGATAYLARVADGFTQEFLKNEKPLPFRTEWWYWNATRVIQHPDTEAGPINEFPFFTFLYGDLHPHMMALPLTLLAVGLGLSLLGEKTKREAPGCFSGPSSDGFWKWPHAKIVSLILMIFMLALTIGALWPTNTWDYPSYLVLALAALLLRGWRRDGRLTLASCRNAIALWVAIVVLSRILYAPFGHWYGAAYTRAELWKGSRTSVSDYLIIHGFFLFLVLSGLVADFFHGPGQGLLVRTMRQAIVHPLRICRYLTRVAGLRHAMPWLIAGSVLFGGGFLAGVALLKQGFHLPGILVILLTLTVALLLRRKPSPRRQYVLVLTAMGLSLSLMVEFIVLQGDISRMNTVFKFYLQAWVVFALASAFWLFIFLEFGGRLFRQKRPLLLRLARLPAVFGWLLVFVLLFGITLLYPIFATYGRAKDRFDMTVGNTLDGSAFLEKATHHDRGIAMPLIYEKQAMEWLQDNVEGSPVIAEANTNPVLYGWGQRYAMFTGLPTIIGWDWHQRQQRAAVPGDLVPRRIQDVQTLYNTTDEREAGRILRRYNVRYIIVGPMERVYYSSAGLAKFSNSQIALWTVVYENPEVRILRVNMREDRPL